MKQFTVFLLAFLCAVACVFPHGAALCATTTQYALVVTDNAMLLREPTAESLENSYFRLPKTYFVTVVHADYTDTLHKVRYRDMVGYVEKTCVNFVDYTPASVYPETVTLRIHADATAVNVRARPNHDASAVVYTLPQGTTGIEYYGVTVGTELGSNGNVWYYVKITPSSDSVVRGYVYAPYVMLESSIPAINDTSAITPPQTELPDGSDDPLRADAEVAPLKIIAIVALCVPAIAVVCIIFSRPRRKKQRVGFQE